MEKSRYLLLDQLRGLAIILMVLFHLAFDLNYFLFVDIDFVKDSFWLFFQWIITFIFLTCVGISLAVVHQGKIKWRRVLTRFATLSGWAALISVVTYLIFPEHWIYFGILHCIALSSLVGVLFLRIPVIAGVLGVTVLLLELFFDIALPWIRLSHHSLDYIGFSPWFGAVLLGIFLHHIRFHTRKIEAFPAFPFV